jgi:hypothetical protein
MPRHVAEFLATGATPLAPGIDDLLLIWTASTPEDWTNRIVAIPLH